MKCDGDVPKEVKCDMICFDAFALRTVWYRSTRSTSESDHYVYFRNLRLKKRINSINTTTHLLFSFSITHTQKFSLFLLVSLLFPFFLYLSQYHLNNTGWYSYGCVLYLIDELIILYYIILYYIILYYIILYYIVLYYIK